MTGPDPSGSAEPSTNGRKPQPKDLAAAMREIYRLRHEGERHVARERALARELADLQIDREAAGVTSGPIYDRPSLSDARKVAERIRKAVRGLAAAADEGGFGLASVKATEVLDDLALLSVAPVRGPIQAHRRDLARRFLTHPALLTQLVRRGPGRAYALKVFNELLSSAYSEPGFRRVFEKSAEIHETRRAST